MSKKSIADVSAELFKLLEPFEPADRARLVRGTLTLLGDTPLMPDPRSPAAPQVGGTGAGDTRLTDPRAFADARAFFDTKSPQLKMEELATAARYFESTTGTPAVRKEDFKAVFDAARRNFDSANFARDVDNARKAGFFNKGGGKKAGYTLSYYGQNYIDALPDRAAATAIKRPKRTKPGEAQETQVCGNVASP